MRLRPFVAACLTSVLLTSPTPAAAYSHAYIPHVKAGKVVSYLKNKKETCPAGKAYPYPKKAGVCAVCPDNGFFMANPASAQYECFVCPPATLLVLKSGVPLCLSDKPAEFLNGRDFDDAGIQKIKEDIVATLSAEYVVADLAFPPEIRQNADLVNVCSLDFPDDVPEAERAVAACRKIKETNDFLCPYVSQTAQGKWLCRACPKNAPYKNENDACFSCPSGQESVLSKDGTPACSAI